MLTSLLWSLGGLVLAGGSLWIAALFVPTIAILLKAALDFLRSPLGSILGIGALALFLFASGYVGGDLHGTLETKTAWRAAEAAAANAEALREAALKQKMAREAEAALGADQSFTTSIDQQVQKNEAENLDRSVCRRATGADIGRLFAIH